MPVATVDPNKFSRFDLKSAPPDGFVELRPLPFGMVLERQDSTLQMQMKGRRPQDRKKQNNQLPDIDLKNLNKAATEYDFAYCIGDHNLTDVNGVLLDFTNPLVFAVLDPRIAQEISEYIDSLNNPEDMESAEDFIRRATSSHTAEAT